VKNCLLLLSWLLAGPLAARAQDAPPTNYQTEHDSLWQRAARVRTFVEARIAQSHSTFMALGGTSRRTQSRAGSGASTSESKAFAYPIVKKDYSTLPFFNYLAYSELAVEMVSYRSFG